MTSGSHDREQREEHAFYSNLADLDASWTLPTGPVENRHWSHCTGLMCKPNRPQGQ